MKCQKVELSLQFILGPVGKHRGISVSLAWLENAGNYLSSLFSFEQRHP